MTNALSECQKTAYGDSRGSAIFIYIKVPAILLLRPVLTGCNGGATKISLAVGSPVKAGMESLRRNKVRSCSQEVNTG